MRSVWLIAKSVLIEAVRRREIYAVVVIACLLIGAVMATDFFGLRGLTKFYREVALHVMSVASAFTVMVLAARQLPREFEKRTIYVLLARPVGRLHFLLGKLLGVMIAGLFSFLLFMTVALVGLFYLQSPIPWTLLIQFIYLQVIMFLILATLCFWLSMFLHLDATLVLAFIFFFTASVFSNMTSQLYAMATPLGQFVIKVLTFGLPQLILFDLTEKTVHAAMWKPLDMLTLWQLTLYGQFYATLYFGFAYVMFRRKPL